MFQKHGAEGSVCTGTHRISLPHVAVEDSPHALDCRMLQLVIPAHVVINAPREEWKRDWVMRPDKGLHKSTEELDRAVVSAFKRLIDL